MKDRLPMSLTSQSWLVWALLSALFAALTAIFAKVGIGGVDSDLATFIRTIVIGIVLATILTGMDKFQGIGAIASRTWIFLVLSGLATGASWLCYLAQSPHRSKNGHLVERIGNGPRG